MNPKSAGFSQISKFIIHNFKIGSKIPVGFWSPFILMDGNGCTSNNMDDLQVE
jgi:hypothetical protein